jgi:succinate dehydrogenase/fumarate reductase flavoprotein subunit
MGLHRSSGTLTAAAAAAAAAPAGPGPETVIDIGLALDLLAAVVRNRGTDFVRQPMGVEEPRKFTCRYANGGTPNCIVGQVLAHVGIDVPALEALGEDGVGDLYAAGRLPCRVTLGAVAVLRAAQRCQDRGCRWGEVLDDAVHAALRILDLLPDSTLQLAGEPSA